MAYTTGLWRRLVVSCLVEDCKCLKKAHYRDETAKHEPECQYTPNMTFKWVEDERELKVTTFLNTVIAVTPTPEGRQDDARHDKTKPHKRVKFDASITKEGKVAETNVKSSSADIPTYQTPADLPTELTPSAIEQLILCKCPNHKHCLTCTFSNSNWATYLKELSLPDPKTQSTRWIAPFYTLDRALKIWLGEHVNSLGGWSASVKGSHANNALKDQVHLSYAISEMVHDHARKVFYCLHKARKTLKEVIYFAQQIIALEKQPTTDKLKEALKVYKTRYLRSNTKLSKLIVGMVHSLAGLENKLGKQIKEGTQSRSLRCIREYLTKDGDTERAWPASSRKKLKLVHGILILVLKDVRYAHGKSKELAKPWIVDQAECQGREKNGQSELEGLDGSVVQGFWKVLIKPTMENIEGWYGPAQRGHCEFLQRADGSAMFEYGARLPAGCNDCGSLN